MSDVTSLLLRLEMEEGGAIFKKHGLELKERWREVANFYEDHLLDSIGNNFFFDVHVLIGLLFGGDKTAAVDKLCQNFLEVSKDNIGVHVWSKLGRLYST